jgi:hypothetical protein
MVRMASRLILVALLTLAVAGMVAAAGSVPHLHDDPGTGLYDHDHDLTLLAGLAAHVIPVDAAPLPPVDVTRVASATFVRPFPAVRVNRDSDPRGPPPPSSS